jgi:hypothetical protein
MLEDGAAGRAAVEILIESGKLVPDFWLRVESQKHLDLFQREEQVSNAVQFAMGKAGIELPEWASPARDSPDCVWVHPEFKNRFPTTEPYYSPANMYRAFEKCDGNVDLDTRAGQQLERSYLRLAWRSWRRLVPHFSETLSQQITDIELERGNNGHDFSKSYRKDDLLSGVMIRDTPLYDFYIGQGETGLRQVFHGIGRKAILGVGAMLFLSGEHDDLVHTAEQLSDELNHS